jgi:hypothetical protein
MAFLEDEGMSPDSVLPQAAAAGGDPTIAPSFAVLTPDLLTAFAKLPSPPSSLW